MVEKCVTAWNGPSALWLRELIGPQPALVLNSFPLNSHLLLLEVTEHGFLIPQVRLTKFCKAVS